MKFLYPYAFVAVANRVLYQCMYKSARFMRCLRNLSEKVDNAKYFSIGLEVWQNGRMAEGPQSIPTGATDTTVFFL